MKGKKSKKAKAKGKAKTAKAKGKGKDLADSDDSLNDFIVDDEPKKKAKTQKKR